MSNTINNSNQSLPKKKEPEKPIDEKKEKMKNALFSGIQKNSELSDDEKKEEVQKVQVQQVTNEVNLLDMPTEISMGESNPMPQQQQPGNLLDEMFDTPAQPTQPPAPQQNITDQLDSILGGNMFNPSPPQIKYSGI